jgi:hypothetical protein
MSWRRRRRRRQAEAEARLQEDCRRALGFLAAVLVDARRLDVPVDEGVLACVAVLQAWADRLDRSGLDR